MFDTAFQLAADYDYFARALKVERPLFVNRPLSRFRLYDENLSKAHDAIRAESVQLAKRHGAVLADDPALRAVSIWATRIEILARSPRWYVKKQLSLINY